jgi:hypothetical protein
MLIAQPRAVTAPQTLEQPPAVDAPHALLFAEIVGQPPEAAPKEIVQPRGHLLTLLPRWIIYLALLAAVTLPLLAGEALLARTVEPVPGVTDFYQQVEALPEGAQVLVAFDYDPTHSGEMDVLARTIVAHLMDREARIVAVSLLPAGPATAQALLEDLAAGRPAYQSGDGQGFANMGYLPGQAAAVRLLGQSFGAALPQDFQGRSINELGATQGLVNVDSFDLVVELAATRETLRWWVEQADAPYDISLAAGVSAAVAPLIHPYYETPSRQLVGLVGGVQGAAMYEVLRGDQTEQADITAARLDAQLAGHLIMIVVLVLGAMIQLVRRDRGGH